MAQVQGAMTQVDRVIQTNAAAAEELSSTAEEMASLTLQQLMSFFQTKAPATHLNRFSAMRYQSPPASAAENESDRGLHHQRTRARIKPLDGPPNANGEDDEFTRWR
jgi:methyl-accepting chemotaxis protein